MRMLRWMGGHTKQDRIGNAIITEKIRMAPIAEIMVESYLRWFGHVSYAPKEGLLDGG